MLNCKAEDRQVDGLFINSLIVLLFLLLLCFCGSFCHLPCVRAASGSYREKEQRGGGVEQKKGTKALVNTKGKRVDGVEFLVNKNREQNKAQQ